MHKPPAPRPCIWPGCLAGATLAYLAVDETGRRGQKITRPGGGRVYSCAGHSFAVINRINEMLADSPQRPARIRAVPLR